MTGRKILVLSLWWPYPADNGSRLRAYHLLRQLARQGHLLRLIAGVQEDAETALLHGIPRELTDLCETVTPVKWHWYDAGNAGTVGAVRALLSTTPRSILETPNPEMTAQIRRALQQPTDAVLAIEIGMDAYLPNFPASVPVVLDQVEVSGVERAYKEAQGLPAQLRTGLTYYKSRAYWQKRFRRYALLTAVSEAEAAAVRKVVRGDKPDVAVVANGVDVSAFPNTYTVRRVPGQMLYNGSLTYAPNREAVLWFANEILPTIAKRMPNAKLIVTGKYTKETATGLSDNPRIQLTGFLPDLALTLAESSVCVVPLREGGGTRLKILEAFAAYLPVVATTIGAAGIRAENGKHLRLADTANDFAGAVVSLLENPVQAEALAANARRLAETRFDWAAIGLDLSMHLTNAIENAK